jgi:hypothetical protein
MTDKYIDMRTGELKHGGDRNYMQLTAALEASAEARARRLCGEGAPVGGSCGCSKVTIRWIFLRDDLPGVDYSGYTSIVMWEQVYDCKAKRMGVRKNLKKEVGKGKSGK